MTVFELSLKLKCMFDHKDLHSKSFKSILAEMSYLLVLFKQTFFLLIHSVFDKNQGPGLVGTF